MNQQSPSRSRALGIVAALVVAQSVLVLAFVLPAHRPELHDVPVVAVGSAAAVQALQERTAGELAVSPRPDRADAMRSVLDRDAYGAVVLDADGDPSEVITASAASPTVAQLLTTTAGPEATVRDVRPLDPDDPRGATLSLMLLPLIVICLPLAVLLGHLGLRAKEVLGATALFATGGGLLVTTLVAGALGALPGPFLALAGVAVLVVAAIALPVAAFVRLLGTPGVAVGAVLFLLIGNPGSGAAAAPELLPGFWRAVGPLLPPGAGIDALRGIAYFDAAGVADGLAVLAVWAVAGVALLLGPPVLERARVAARTPVPADAALRAGGPALGSGEAIRYSERTGYPLRCGSASTTNRDGIAASKELSWTIDLSDAPASPSASCAWAR